MLQNVIYSILITSDAIPWAKIHLLWKNSLGNGTVASNNTPSVGELSELTDRSENTTVSFTQSSVTITYDAGVGNQFYVDYAALSEHTLSDNSYTVAIAQSDDGSSWTTFQSATSPPLTNKSFAMFFEPRLARYFRFTFAGSGGFTISNLFLGQRTELDWVDRGLDPHAQNWDGDESINEAGYLVQQNLKFIERNLFLDFGQADPGLYAKVKELWESIQRQNFFAVWEKDDHPNEVFFVRMADGRFQAPFIDGGAYRNLRFSLVGRKE